MKFRTARHTANLQRIIDFYCGILGLEILGKFDDHDGYDGIFLGRKETDWEIEFTVSHDLPEHQPDDDDLFVFYAATETELAQMRESFRQHNIPEENAKNPYWALNGVTYKDPDGFRIVISKRP